MNALAHGITVGVTLALVPASLAQEGQAPVETSAQEVRRLAEEANPSVFDEASVFRPYAQEGTTYWGLTLDGAVSGDGQTVGPRLSVHHFLADGFEVHASIGVWGHFQDGTDAVSVNPSLGFRYHFVREETHTIYADIGIGLLLSNEEVPDDGTRTNFTPRAGIGATFPLGHDGARLDLGLRWHHVSNASTSGTDDNPDRDSLGFYAGVLFPF